MWLVTLPVAAFLIWFGWTRVGTGSTGGGLAFLVVWTVGFVTVEAWNFRTMYLGRGRHAQVVDRGSEDRSSR